MAYVLPDGIPATDDWPSECAWLHDPRRLNFSWVDVNVAGCECPKLDKDLAFLKQQGITALVGIWEEGKSSAPTERKVLRNGLIRFLREPIPDFTAPPPDQTTRILAWIDESIRDGHKVAVACGYGEGRTGTVLSCYFISRGLQPSDALRVMCERGRIPYENQHQRDFILAFAPSPTTTPY